MANDTILEYFAEKNRVGQVGQGFLQLSSIFSPPMDFGENPVLLALLSSHLFITIPIFYYKQQQKKVYLYYTYLLNQKVKKSDWIGRRKESLRNTYIMAHNCEICLKSFKQKGHLDAHKNRKNPCKKTDTIDEIVEKKVQEALAKVAITNATVPTVKNEIIVPKSKARPKIGKLPDTVNNKIRMIDLFAGTGAFSTAFESTGSVECVFANDMVQWSKEIYDLNHSHPLLLQDLNTVDVTTIPAHDILTGGFPCQPFSIAGKREGFDDARSNVFWKILEIVDHHRPRALVLENVKNLVSHDEGRTFTTIKGHLEERGYSLCTKVLDTCEITGVPQHRERIYLVCLRDKDVFDRFNLDFPEMEKRGIEELLDPEVAEKYYYTNKSSTWGLVSEAVVERGVVYQYRRVYIRENKSHVCPTLTANMGGGGHNVPLVLDNKGIRKLTPRECFRFQGFPDSYQFPKGMSDTNLYKLAGNAVSLPVVKLIAERLIPLLSEK